MTGEKIPELERVGQTSRNSIGGNQKGKRGKDMKTFKKVLASTLAAAMVVTALPVTPANAAATPKLSTTKAAVYVGGSKTLSVKTPSSWKKVKVKATSNKKSIAKISKVSGKKVTVKAVKKGTAKVTVKVTAKKGKKKVSKTLKATVTVKNPSITLNQSKVTLNVGETTPVKVTKKTPSSIAVKYSSEDPAIASVSKGTITAISAGTTNIVVTAKYGSKTFTKKVAVTVNTVKDGLTTALTNQLSATDYPNTVLVSDPAIINVTYTKGGKPVAGQTLVISKDNTVSGINDGSYVFENATATTDASGVATFVVKNGLPNVKTSDTSQVASVNYRIQLANSSAETGTQSVTGTVNFASISVNNVDVKTDPKKLAPGTNFKGTSAIKKRYYVTNTNQGDKYSEYVLSQQVSAAGTEEHAVTFNGGYPVITLPGTKTDATTTKGSQEINYTSGAYKTYATNKQTFKLDKEPKELSYATLNFKDVSISKYTTLEIYAYDNENSAAKDITADAFDTKVYDGEMTEGKFGYQIPLNKANPNAAGVWIVVKIVSKGQVQDGKNNGYTATNIDFVYKNPQGTKGKEELYKNGQVTWKQVDTPYTADQKVASLTDINNVSFYNGSNTEAFDTTKYNYSVKLPVFPYTGDAVITKTDKNGKVVGYYAVATVNYRNNKNEIEKYATAYQISADEVKETTGTITQKDNVLTVNAEKAGRMTLEGVVTINGKEIAEADLAHVYTSVQWNPVPKASAAAKNYVALLGQKIEVIGQLVDKNGNAVSTSGETVDFYAGGKQLVANTSVAATNGKASVVSVKNTTDTQGQAKVTLKASDIITLQNVTAKTSSKYDVVLKIVKDETVETADLYWVDADLAFQDKVNETDGKKPVTVATDTVNNDVKTGTKADTKPEVGTSWFYGVYTKGTYYDVAAKAPKEVSINGIDAAISKSVESVGSMESLGEGVAKVTSTKAGAMNLVSKIDATTGTTKATVAKDGFTFAGTGASSINKKLTINVAWQTQGVTASYIVPTGTRVTTGDSFNVYVKVQDNLGNPIKDQNVYFSVDNGSAATIDANTTPSGVFKSGTDDKGKTYYKTTADGIASVTLTPLTAAKAGETITVTAKVGEDTFDQTFRWVASNAADAPALNKAKNEETGKYLTYFDRNAKTVSIVFDKDIVTESVIKKLFNVYIGDDGANTDPEYKVTNAVANGNVVTLTLADVPSTITAKDKVFVTINSKALDSVNVEHTLTATNGMAAVIKNVTIDANNVDEPKFSN